ncbi:MAG: DUF4388 domain-containing protein [Pseudomonadota bacterium]
MSHAGPIVAARSNGRTEDSGEGFSGRFERASLADLVQLECQSGSERVIRVTSGDEVGYLYFRGGRIVHAVTASAMGEAAALEILSWTTGRFEPCSAGWPELGSITTSCQALLLRAAQMRDEQRARDEDSGRRHVTELVARAPTKPRRAEEGTMAQEGKRRASEPPRSDAPSESVLPRGISAVRLDPSGAVLSSRGSTSEELTGIVALAARLGSLIGEALGLEQLRALEGISKATRTVIVVEKTGNIVGLTAPVGVDMGFSRERIGI